jgi:hypothetical protein
MAVVFAISTIATYVLLCVYSTAGLERMRLGAFERYGEALSGAFIALVGLAFWRDRSLRARHAGFWQQFGNTPSAHK